MRVSTFSIAATLLIAAGIFTFWPGRNAAPGAAAVVAQVAADPFGAPQGKESKTQPPVAPDPFAPAAGPASKPRNVVEEELNKVTIIEVVETSLSELVVYIQDIHKFPILIKTKRIEEAGVPIDTPITKTLKGVRLSTALDHILDELDLTYVVEDELVLITTPQDAQSRLEIRVYDCRDLLASKAATKTKAAAGAGSADSGFGTAGPGATGEASALAGEGGGYGGVATMPGGMMMPGMGGYGGGSYSEHDHRAQRLMSIITTNVDDRTWQMTAHQFADGSEQPPRGRGTISEYDGLIVVTQTAQTHRKIERVLDMLRRASGLEDAKTNKVVR